MTEVLFKSEFSKYRMSKKYWPILYSMLLYKIGHYLDIQHLSRYKIWYIYRLGPWGTHFLFPQKVSCMGSHTQYKAYSRYNIGETWAYTLCPRIFNPFYIISYYILYVQDVVILQKKLLIYLRKKMRFTPFINLYDTLGWIVFVYRAK